MAAGLTDHIWDLEEPLSYRVPPPKDENQFHGLEGQHRITDIDFIKPSITVWGKGSVEREIALEKKGIHALKSYLAIRPDSISTRVFLNYQGEPISERGIRKLVVKYRKEAGITKKASCHTLRHTFATYKAEKGVSPFQLQQWLGHANLNTTQIYVHLGKQNARKIMQDTNL
jgi:site-specific recombinase XerD